MLEVARSLYDRTVEFGSKPRSRQKVMWEEGLCLGLRLLSSMSSSRGNNVTSGKIRELVQYVTNAQGEPTGVLVPLDVWEDLLKSWQAFADELGQVDEAEPKEQILADLKDALRQVKAGQTLPIAELWDGIDV